MENKFPVIETLFSEKGEPYTVLYTTLNDGRVEMAIVTSGRRFKEHGYMTIAVYHGDGQGRPDFEYPLAAANVFYPLTKNGPSVKEQQKMIHDKSVIAIQERVYDRHAVVDMNSLHHVLERVIISDYQQR